MNKSAGCDEESDVLEVYWVHEKCSFNKCFVWGFELLNFRNVFSHLNSSYQHRCFWKLTLCKLVVLKQINPPNYIASSLKIEKIMYRSHNLVSLYCLWIDQNISLDQRFLLMMKDFWRIIIWKIYFCLSAQINRCVDWWGKLGSFVYHIEPTYYIVTWCLFSLEYFCKTYSF